MEVINKGILNALEMLGLGDGKQKSDVIQILSEKYSPAVVAAIIGNIDVETGGSFDPGQKQYNNGKGRGIFQMESGMLEAYNKYIQDRKISNTAQAQINFMSNILSSGSIYDIGAGNRKKVKEAFDSGDVDRITKEFSNRVLRPGTPHLDRRLNSARSYMKDLQNNVSSSGEQQGGGIMSYLEGLFK